MHPSPRPLRSLPERSACPRSEHSAHAALPGIGAGFHALGPMMTVWARLTRERMRPDQPRASFCLLFRCTGTLAAIQGMSVQNAFIVMHDSQGAAPKPRRPTGWPCGGIAEMCRFIRVSRDRGRGLAMHTRVSLLHLAEGPAVLLSAPSPPCKTERWVQTRLSGILSLRAQAGLFSAARLGKGGLSPVLGTPQTWTPSTPR